MTNALGGTRVMMFYQFWVVLKLGLNIIGRNLSLGDDVEKYYAGLRIYQSSQTSFRCFCSKNEFIQKPLLEVKVRYWLIAVQK